MQVRGKNSIGLNMKSMELEREMGIKLSINNIGRIPVVRLSFFFEILYVELNLSIGYFCPSFKAPNPAE
jgi:hypothetical protein